MKPSFPTPGARRADPVRPYVGWVLVLSALVLVPASLAGCRTYGDSDDSKRRMDAGERRLLDKLSRKSWKAFPADPETGSVPVPADESADPDTLDGASPPTEEEEPQLDSAGDPFASGARESFARTPEPQPAIPAPESDTAGTAAEAETSAGEEVTSTQDPAPAREPIGPPPPPMAAPGEAGAAEPAPMPAATHPDPADEAEGAPVADAMDALDPVDATVAADPVSAPDVAQAASVAQAESVAEVATAEQAASAAEGEDDATGGELVAETSAAGAAEVTETAGDDLVAHATDAAIAARTTNAAPTAPTGEDTDPAESPAAAPVVSAEPAPVEEVAATTTGDAGPTGSAEEEPSRAVAGADTPSAPEIPPAAGTPSGVDAPAEDAAFPEDGAVLTANTAGAPERPEKPERADRAEDFMAGLFDDDEPEPETVPDGDGTPEAAEAADGDGLLASPDPGADGLSIELRDVPLKDLIRALAQQDGLNVVVPESLTDQVSISLDSVQPREALESILRTYGFQLTSNGPIHMVEPIPEETRRLVSRTFTLTSVPIATVEETLQSILSQEGKLILNEDSPSFVMIDHPDNVDAMEEYLRLIDRREKQVLIEVEILEVILSKSDAIGTALEILDISIDDVTGAYVHEILPTDPITSLALTANKSPITLLIQTLSVHRKLNILSSPRLLTLNGREALIEVLAAIPFIDTTATTSTTTEGGGSTTVQQVEFAESGITLKVTPVIGNDSYVKLKIVPEVKELVDFFNGIPVIDTRKIDTNVLVKDGHTIILGGLLREEELKETQKTPFLGDIPLLGALFRRRELVTEKSELLVFITPHIVDTEQEQEIHDSARSRIDRARASFREASERK